MPEQDRQSRENAASAAGDREKTAKRFSSFSVVLAAVAVFAVAFAGGFVWFCGNLLLAKAPENLRGDAIVVLTGGPRRIDAALRLLEEGAGERLLISGVNPSTSGESIRKLTGGDSALFDCCVDIGYEALTTQGNAAETRQWLADHDYERVIVVTSGYHLPRSLFELRSIDPDTTFIGYPVASLSDNAGLAEKFKTLKIVGAEYLKFIGAHVRAYTGLEKLSGTGLQSEAANLPEQRGAV